MKVAAGCILLAAGLLAAGAQSPLSKLERTWLLSREYVRLSDWARANNFQMRWLSKVEVRLTSSRTTLDFTTDSRKMECNGIAVWLSVPIAARSGAAYIAPLDLSTAVHPVVFPVQNPVGRLVRHVCLDAGHGGKDPGKGEGIQQEKKYTLLLAKELAAQLSKAGFKVTHTRTRDKTLELAERTQIAQRQKADLFVSLHYNAAGGSEGRSVSGAEVYCLTPARASSTNARGEGANSGPSLNNRFDAKNMLLAYQVQRALVRSGGLDDRGVKRARFQVLREAEMPAVLIEAGFMTHPTESRKIYDAAYREKTARAIVEGLAAYRRLVDPPSAVVRRAS